MEVKIKNLGESKVELEIEMSAEDFDGYREKAAVMIARQVKINGFRPGKVPPDVLRQKVGEEKILTEAASMAVKASFRRAVLENSLEPISQPEVQILKLASQNPFCFKAVFFVLPQVELPDYRRIASRIKKEEVLVSKEELEQVLNWLQKSRANLSQVERPAQKGDFVEISFSCREVHEGKEQKDAFTLGEGHLLKKFEKELEGMKTGEEKEFSIDLPESYYQKDLAGKRVGFQVKMNSVKKVKLPELSDGFAKSLGNFQDLEALKKNVKDGLKKEKEADESLKRREKILSAIDKEIKLELPGVLIEAEKQRRLHDLKHRVADELQISFEEYLKKINKTEEDLLKLLEKESVKGTRRFLLLREMAKQEKIVVSEQEVEEEVNKILARYKNAEQANPVRSNRSKSSDTTGVLSGPKRTSNGIDLEQLRGYTKENIRNEKVFQLLESLVQN